MKKSYLTVTDQFCGAGGSSQGAHEAGLEVAMALNHWKLAIETHQTNFPNTLHDCTDISACDPRRYPSTDILITSPECTNHSLAKGKKIVKAQLGLYDSGAIDPAAERSRATMWDVPRFAEYHNYNLIIVENVVDARKWVMFDAWLMAMHSLGYKHECVYLNSMHCHPTPQSRDRMYVVFWKKGNKAPDLRITPEAYCPKCEKNVESVQTWKNPKIRFGKYRQQYIYCCPRCASVVEPYYYAAFNCIDWSNLGTRIGDMPLTRYYDKKGKLLTYNGMEENYLSPNTLARIDFGRERYKNCPYVVTSRYTSGIDCRVNPVTKEIGTQPGDVSHGIAMPFIINGHHSSKTGDLVKGMPTICTNEKYSLAIPFIIKTEHSSNLENAKHITEPVQTQTTRQTMAIAVAPWIIEMNRTGTMKPASDPTSTFTSGGINHAMAINAIIGYYYGTNQASSPIEALGTCTTKDRSFTVIEPTNTCAIEDVYYRMLKSGEVGKAMAFGDSYKVLGSEKNRVKQYGNAVTPPAMKLLIKRAVEALS